MYEVASLCYLKAILKPDGKLGLGRYINIKLYHEKGNIVFCSDNSFVI